MRIGEAISLLRASFPDESRHPASHLRLALQWATEDIVIESAKYSSPVLRYSYELDLEADKGKYRLPPEFRSVVGVDRTDLGGTDPTPISPLSFTQRGVHSGLHSAASMFDGEASERVWWGTDRRGYWIDNRDIQIRPLPVTRKHGGLIIYMYACPVISLVDDEELPLPRQIQPAVIRVAKTKVEPPPTNPADLSTFERQAVQALGSLKELLLSVENDIGFRPAEELLV